MPASIAKGFVICWPAVTFLPFFLAIVMSLYLSTIARLSVRQSHAQVLRSVCSPDLSICSQYILMFLSSSSTVVSNIPHTRSPHPCSSCLNILPKYTSALSSRGLSSLTSLHSDSRHSDIGTLTVSLPCICLYLICIAPVCSVFVTSDGQALKYTMCCKPLWVVVVQKMHVCMKSRASLVFKFWNLLIELSFKHLFITVNTEFYYL